jgi:hypothetical protein
VTAPAPARLDGPELAALLTDIRAKHVPLDDPRSGVDAAYLDGLVEAGPTRWHITDVGKTELARLTGKTCAVCGQPSLAAECRTCAVADEADAKRREDS